MSMRVTAGTETGTKTVTATGSALGTTMDAIVAASVSTATATATAIATTAGDQQSESAGSAAANWSSMLRPSRSPPDQTSQIPSRSSIKHGCTLLLYTLLGFDGHSNYYHNNCQTTRDMSSSAQSWGSAASSLMSGCIVALEWIDDGVEAPVTI